MVWANSEEKQQLYWEKNDGNKLINKKKEETKRKLTAKDDIQLFRLMEKDVMDYERRRALVCLATPPKEQPKEQQEMHFADSRKLQPASLH